MTIGWALLGPGRHVERNVAWQIEKAAGIRRVAVMSRDRERGAAFAQKYGFAKVYTALPELLADPEIDAIYDATPDGRHADNIVAAAAAGKHTLVEKPMAISPAECERAIAACRSHGVKLGVVYQQRHEEVLQEARRMVGAGEIGDVILARIHVTLRNRPGAAAPAGGNWRADPAMRHGGTLGSLGDHAFDTLTFLVGQEIEQVTAFTDATDDDTPNERIAGMMLKLSGGTIAQSVSGGKAPFARRPIELHGAGGSIIIENGFAYLTGTGDDPRTSLELINADGSEVRYFDQTECFRLEIEQFSRAVEGSGAPMTTAEEGLHAIRVSAEFYQALRDGRVANVAPPA